MTRRPVMSRDEVSAFIDREFPQIHYDGRLYQIEAVGPLTARVRLDFHERHVRPGGTLSGPAMMTLADFALARLISSAMRSEPIRSRSGNGKRGSRIKEF